jgi:hypothetical protein
MRCPLAEIPATLRLRTGADEDKAAKVVKATRGWCEPGDRHAVTITSEPPEEHARGRG